MKWCIYNIDSI